MKKVTKTILCLVVAISMCLSMGFVALADEASDVSLDDLLALLSQLSGGDTEEVTEEPVTDNTVTIGAVNFVVPEGFAELSEESLEGELTYINDDASEFLTVNYFEAGEEENIDLTDETNVQYLMEAIGGDGEITASDYVDIDGNTGLWMQVEGTESGMTFVNYDLVLQAGNGLAVFSFISMNEDGADVFQSIMDSISVNADAPAPAPAAAAGGAMDVPEDAIDATLVDEVVLIDDDVCKIALKKFSTDDDYYGFTCKVYLENKTDLNLYFSADYTAVNDYMASSYFGETVAPGHKTNAELHVYRDDLEENNITDIGKLTLKMIVRDDDDWSADYLEEQVFNILPFGADVPAQPEQQFSDDDIVLVDQDGVRMILTGFDATDNYYFLAKVYCENNTDKDLRFDTGSSSAINGYEINPYLYEYVPAGKKVNTDIHWYWEDLEDNDIETIEDIELALEIEDYNDYWADPIFEDTIYLTLE